LSYLDDLLWALNQTREVILRRRDEAAKVIVEGERKKADLTRRIDLISEREVERRLRERGLQAYLASEETQIRKIGEKPEVIVVLDPIDGTRNFVNSIPFYAISAALGKVNGGNPTIEDLVVGVVKDIPSGDVWYAVKGEGAYYNGKRIVKVPLEVKETPVISLYYSGEEALLNPVTKLLSKFKVRVLGSLALELCYVASGRLDGLIDARGKARLVDIAAGKIILEEAGGVVSDAHGNPLSSPLKEVLNQFYLVASRDENVHSKLLKTLGGGV